VAMVVLSMLASEGNLERRLKRLRSFPLNPMVCYR
jgi:hypothetical protein